MVAQQKRFPEKIVVVVADDARHLLEQEKAFFPPHEFDVFMAQNGCEAYNLIKTVGPDIAFLDLFMPVLSGAECCRLIKSDLLLRKTPIVLIAPEDSLQQQRCQDANCDLVLTKPVRRKEFLSAVQALKGQLSRVPVRWPARIAAELHDDNGFCLPVMTVNISEHGAYLESESMPRMGKNYRLILKLQSDLEVPVQIAWFNPRESPRNRSLPAGFGVQFLAVKGDVRSTLHNLMGVIADPAHSEIVGEVTPSQLFVELPLITGKSL